MVFKMRTHDHVPPASLAFSMANPQVVSVLLVPCERNPPIADGFSSKRAIDAEQKN